MQSISLQWIHNTCLMKFCLGLPVLREAVQRPPLCISHGGGEQSLAEHP